MLRPFAGEMHRTQRVLEARMLGGGEDPPCALELVDATEPLQPSGVDQVLLRRISLGAARTLPRDAKVSVDGIAEQVDPGVLLDALRHEPIITVNALLAEGITLFNGGQYWEAHEVWERAWTPDRKGSDSGFYKGLIQIAAGCLHYRRRNRRGTVNKWRSGAAYLGPYLPAHEGVALAPLVEVIGRHLAAMSSGDTWPELAMPVLEAASSPAGEHGHDRDHQ